MRFASKILPWFFAVILLCLWTGTALPRQKNNNAQPPGLRYVVHYEGLIAPGTLALLKGVSQAENLLQSPPDSGLLLERRADEDRAAFKKVFDSQGQFAAKVEYTVDTSVQPAVITYRLDPGPQFDLTSVRILLPDGKIASGAAVPDPAALGLTVPGPFSSKAIVDAGDKLAAYPRHRGYPFAKTTDRQVTANFADHRVSVVWTLDLGPKATIGQARFDGLTSVKETYLRGLIPWQQGQTYDAGLLERYRAKLSKLDLFASVQVEPAASIEENDQVPVTVTVIERKHRTIKGGLDYKTDEGPGANLGWEHRNLFGGGEKLAVTASGSAIERLGEISFEKPDFITPKELFKAKGKTTDEDKKAYKGQSAMATALVRRQFTDSFSAGIGAGYRVTRIEQDHTRPWEDNTLYGFAFVPAEATLDTRNDLLDPTKGVVTSVSFAPYFGTMSKRTNFVRPEVSAATYLKLAEKPGLVLAVRAMAGANIGTSRDKVSPDLRFYAGGSGSIRGYPYQTVGPLNGDTPIGGASVFTFSAELRWRITELIGLVPFLDGGSAFTEQLPPYRQELLLGAGLGLRIYTPVGPIRLDMATPLNRRKDIDDIAQFYCSIGQSF
ncbi:MAG: autotransporter assembly complex family protein [Desulfovibrionaceae bacterium]